MWPSNTQTFGKVLFASGPDAPRHTKSMLATTNCPRKTLNLSPKVARLASHHLRTSATRAFTSLPSI